MSKGWLIRETEESNRRLSNFFQTGIFLAESSLNDIEAAFPSNLNETIKQMLVDTKLLRKFVIS